MNWDDKFMDLAKLVSTWSKDRSTQVGAVIVNSDNRVVSLGYNGPPSGFTDDEEDYVHIRPDKYLYFEHGERNCIYNAARLGLSVSGCKIYVTDSREEHLFCCADCARAIIQSGITELVIERPSGIDNNWDKSTRVAAFMLENCGVKITYYEKGKTRSGT